ncbi:MAG: beta-galactosidase [Kiritimatiellales bacterium]
MLGSLLQYSVIFAWQFFMTGPGAYSDLLERHRAAVQILPLACDTVQSAIINPVEDARVGDIDQDGNGDGVWNQSDQFITTGDAAGNQNLSTAVFIFKLPAPSAGKSIDNARVSWFLHDVRGAPPNLQVDVFFKTTNVVEKTDYEAPAILSLQNFLMPTTTKQTTYIWENDADLVSALNTACAAGVEYVAFRLRLQGWTAGNGNGIVDGYTVATVDNTDVARRPALVTQQMPPEFLYGIYAYPARYKSEGVNWPGLIGREAAHLTTLFPDIEEIDGMMLIIYWSLIEPEPGVYRWEIIDEVIDYWKERGKSVAICIAPWAIPVAFSDAWGGIQDAFPVWARADVKHYNSEHITMGNLYTNTPKPLKIPLFLDAKYQEYLTRLITEFGKRYDGNPAISFVRIGIGHIGEEVFPVTSAGRSSLYWTQEIFDAAADDGATVETWYDYCLWLSEQYRLAFKTTPLSINMILAGYLYKKETGEYMQANRLLNYCLIHRIMMGNNGLSDVTLSDIENMEQSPRATYWLLKQYSDAGFPVETEMKSPPQTEGGTDADSMLQAVRLVKPRYINLFGPHIGVIKAYRDPEYRNTSVDWKVFEQVLNNRGEDPEAIAERFSEMVTTLQQYKVK